MVTLVNNSFSRDEEAKRASDVLKVKEERGKIALLSFQIPLHFSLQHFSLLYHVSNVSYFFQIRGILSWCMSTFPNLEAHCLTDARSYIAADPTESWRSVSHWGYSMPCPCHATTLCLGKACPEGSWNRAQLLLLKGITRGLQGDGLEEDEHAHGAHACNMQCSHHYPWKTKLRRSLNTPFCANIIIYIFLFQKAHLQPWEDQPHGYLRQ